MEPKDVKMLDEDKKPATKTPKKGNTTQKKRRQTVTGAPGRKKKGKTADNNADEQGEYAVEKIEAKRIVDGRTEYFIKWQGWSSDANTWEPIEHLANCHLMIQAYENKLAKKKLQGKNGRRGSSCSDQGSSRRENNGFDKSQGDIVMDLFASDSDDDAASGAYYDGEDDLEFPLTECPKGKQLARIHAVAVLDGYLTFLVQWKTEDSEDGRLPPISNMNASMVRAQCMNQAFPQEVIEFYQKRIRFNKSLDSKEEEAKKAALALLEARTRRNELMLKRNQTEAEDHNEDDDDDDPAAKAIEKERLAHDKFDPAEVELSSSSSDDDDLLMDSDEED